MSKVLVKKLLNGIALAAAWPFAATCWLERMLHPGREEFFGFWAHMALTNWATLLVLGMWCGQQSESGAVKNAGLLMVAGECVALIALLGLWPTLLGKIALSADFPFAQIRTAPASIRWLTTSAAVSFLYLTYTWLVFRLAQRLPLPRLIGFLARNTLIVFIVHMPLIFWLTPRFYPLVPQGGLRVLLNLGIFFLLPACLSEVLRRVVRPVWWRDMLRERVVARWAKPLVSPGCVP